MPIRPEAERGRSGGGKSEGKGGASDRLGRMKTGAEIERQLRLAVFPIGFAGAFPPALQANVHMFFGAAFVAGAFDVPTFMRWIVFHRSYSYCMSEAIASLADRWP